MPKKNDFFRDEEFEDTFEVEEDSENEEPEDKVEESPVRSFSSEEDDDEGLKVDKIFDNKFGESDYDGKRVNFVVDQSYYSHEDVEDRFQYKQLFDKIHKLIQDSEFKIFNVMNEEKKMQKLNKIQINQVYSYVVNSLDPATRKIDVFAVMSDYFDIYPNKFYSSLSNKYKNELILELDAALNILKKKKIRKLF